jgi:hypothetical protein
MAFTFGLTMTVLTFSNPTLLFSRSISIPLHLKSISIPSFSFQSTLPGLLFRT